MGRIIGRGRYATETYPETGSGRGVSAALARNSAYGPSSSTALSGAAVAIPWTIVESTDAASPSGHVPITPTLTTGRVRVIAMIGIANTTTATQVGVAVEVNDIASVPLLSASVTVPASTLTEVPFLIDLDLSSFGAGPTYEISILVSATGGGPATLSAGKCSIDISELPAATG